MTTVPDNWSTMTVTAKNEWLHKTVPGVEFKKRTGKFHAFIRIPDLGTSVLAAGVTTLAKAITLRDALATRCAAPCCEGRT